MNDALHARHQHMHPPHPAPTAGSHGAFNQLMRGDVVMSAVTLAELRHGVERNPQIKPAADAAVSYGILAAAIRDRKRDALDRLIAAQAISLGVTLITNNEADFKDYPELIVENWISRA